MSGTVYGDLNLDSLCMKHRKHNCKHKDCAGPEKYLPYWEFMRTSPEDKPVIKKAPHQYNWDVYLAGSLRNRAIPKIIEEMHGYLNANIFADWYAAGPEADDHWKEFYKALGYEYTEALKEPASINTFEFDKKNMLASNTMVLALPAGKSGHLELGWFLGQGKPGYILLDESEDRWDVMYQFATGVTSSVQELCSWLEKDIEK